MSIRKYSPRDYHQILAIYSASKLDELRYEDTAFELLPLDKDTIRLAQLIESDIYLYETNAIVGFCAHLGSVESAGHPYIEMDPTVNDKTKLNVATPTPL